MFTFFSDHVKIIQILVSAASTSIFSLSLSLSHPTSTFHYITPLTVDLINILYSSKYEGVSKSFRTESITK
jgi:hypothetical protein